MPSTRKSKSHSNTPNRTSRRKSLCVACTGLTGHGEAGFLTQQTEAIPAPWLQAIHRQAVPTHTHRFHNLADQGFPDATPVQSDIRIRFTRRTPALPQRVLYWGAGHCAVTCAGAIGGGAVTCAGALQGAERAYGFYDNMGIATRKGHTLEFVMQTPRPYVARQRGATKAQQWCRHVHFVDLKAVEGCVGMGDGHATASTTEADANCATGRCSSTRGRRSGSHVKTTPRNSKPAGGHHEGRTVTGKCPPANNVLYTVAAFPRTKPLQLEGGSYTCTPLFHPEQPSGQAYHHSVFIGFEQYLMAKAKGILGINAIQHADWPPIHDTDMVVDWHATPDAIAQQLGRAKVKREQPLIVYCANEGCEAAQELLYKLTQIGYCNTYYLKHGMEEARAKLAGVGRFLGCEKGRGGGEIMKFNPKRKPDKLNYRPIGECYLLYKGKLVAQNAGHYLSLPGGGIDKGEKPIMGAKRELIEELGAKLKGPLKIISEMTWDWNPSWANNDKRKKRYMQFRGERVYSMIGEVESFGKPTSDEGDAWKGKKTMTFVAATKLMNTFLNDHTPANQYAYNLTKLNIISTMNVLLNKKK